MNELSESCHSAKQPSREPISLVILQKLEQLNMRLTDLHSRVQHKLGPIYIPESKDDKICIAGSPLEDYPELFGQMRETLNNCNYSVNQIEDILNRVEL